MITKDLVHALEDALHGWHTGEGIVRSVMAYNAEDDDVRHACYLAIVRQKYPDFEGDRDEAADRIHTMATEHSTEMAGFITQAIQNAACFVKDGYRFYRNFSKSRCRLWQNVTKTGNVD